MRAWLRLVITIPVDVFMQAGEGTSKLNENSNFWHGAFARVS